MSFLDNWSKKLESSFSEFAELGAGAQDVDLNFGIIGAALLWPVREALEDDEGYDALSEICGPKANQVLRAMRKWADDREAAARDLAEQAQTNDKPQAALNSLSEHFEATARFSEKLAQVLVAQQGEGDVYNLTGQIKAALVNIGGTTNIQSLTVQITQPLSSPAQPDIPPPPEPLALPEISEFVGRGKELAYFADRLTTIHQAVICGMVGIGKTVVEAMLAHVWQAQKLLPVADVGSSTSVDEQSKLF